MSKPGRNDLCHCGSGEKYKKCCESREHRGGRSSRVLIVAVVGAMIAALAVGIVSFTSTPTGGRVWSQEHGHYHDSSGGEVP